MGLGGGFVPPSATTSKSGTLLSYFRSAVMRFRALSARVFWLAARVYRVTSFEVWWADHIGDAEAYLDKAAPRTWVD